MERITYRKTLDVHKNGIQFMLQGFETADNMSRVIEISLMASGDAIDFPLERVAAMMYVTTPSATEPSINECTIKDNKVVYDVLPIVEEGITTMQLKIIETSPEGATSVLASPKFAVEVSKSDADDESAEQGTTFTALEDAMAKAKTVYDERFIRMELTSDCIFKAYYADGTYYETDVLQRLFLNGNVELSKSYAMGGTGVRAGEDTDNSKYYSGVAKSEAVKAKDIMTNSEEVLEEVKLHGVYTAFQVDFEKGEVEYVSPSFKFNVNLDTGELDVVGQTYTFDDEVGRVVEKWCESNGITISDLQKISKTHSGEIKKLQETVESHSENLEILNGVRPVEKGGTGLDKVTSGNFLIGNGIGALVEKTPAEVVELIGIGSHEQRISDMEWTTLGSVAISYDSGDVYPNIEDTKGTYTETYLQNYSIPFDNTLIRECSQVRFVVKNYNLNAKIRETLNSNDDIQVVLSPECNLNIGAGDFTSRITSNTNNIFMMRPGVNHDYTVSMSEDIILRLPSTSQADIYTANLSEETCVMTAKSIPDSIGTVSVYIKTESYKNDYAISRMYCVARTSFSCVVELQARR